MIHQEFGTPQRDVLAQQGFKIPPITPKPTKASGWKLGSGFDGITLRPSAKRKRRDRNGRYARNPCFSGRSLPELELSTLMSPTRQPADQRSRPKSQIHQAGLDAIYKIKPVQELGIRAVKLGPPQMPTKTGETAASVHVASSTALRELTETEQLETASSSCHGGVLREPVQLHLKQEMYSSPSQSIREPSKSEDSG